tara:strand:- start:96 stop:293 length:198 start_codon:yes stop_codon:yes gene_type:complete
MSKENLLNENKDLFSKPKISGKSKVDINILLNKVREEEKKENVSKSILIGFISISVLSLGLFFSA